MFSDTVSKTTVPNMFKEIKDKMENFSRDLKTIKSNQTF